MRMSRRRLLAIIGLFLWGLMTHSTYAGTGDEPHYLAIAHSLAFDRDLDLHNNYRNDEWIVGGVDPGTHVATGRNGTLRPIHDIGMPVVFAPYVAVIHPLIRSITAGLPLSWLDRMRLDPATLYRHFLSAGMIVIALLLADQLLTACLALGLSPPIAYGTALLVLLSPPLSIHSILLFTELLSALLTLVVFRWVVVDREATAVKAAAAGLLTGALVLVHARNAGLVAGFTILVVWTWIQRRHVARTLVFLATLSGALVARAMLTHYLWGTWLTTPHARAGTWDGTMSIFGHRLAGLLIDQEYGLLLYAPIFVLAVFAWRDRRRHVLAAVILTGAYLLPVTNVHGWTGGWSPPARFLVPIVPLLGLLVAVGITRAPRIVIAAIVAIQVVVSAYFWQTPKNLWNDGNGVAAVCQRGGVAICGALPSLVQPADAVRATDN